MVGKILYPAVPRTHFSKATMVSHSFRADQDTLESRRPKVNIVVSTCQKLPWGTIRYLLEVLVLKVLVPLGAMKQALSLTKLLYPGLSPLLIPGKEPPTLLYVR